MAKGNGGPQLGCGAKLIKFCLITFNILFFVNFYFSTHNFSNFNEFLFLNQKILGIVILAIGIYVLVDPKFSYLKNIANFDLTKTAGTWVLVFLYILTCS